MSAPPYVAEPGYGFLSLFEGAALGIAAGWWLQSHYHPPATFVGAGLAVTILYAVLVSCCRKASLLFPVIIVSITVWGLLGWVLGDFAYSWLGGPSMKVQFLGNPLAWKLTGSALFGFMAFSDKGEPTDANAR